MVEGVRYEVWGKDENGICRPISDHWGSYADIESATGFAKLLAAGKWCDGKGRAPEWAKEIVVVQIERKAIFSVEPTYV